MKRFSLGARALSLSIVAAALLAFGLCSNARADSLTLTIANANLATQGAGPYATFTFTYTAKVGGGTTVSVTATALDSFVFGDSNIIDLNLSSTAGTVSNFSGGGILTQGGAGNVNGFGNFNFTLNDGNGFSAPGPYSSLTFSFDVSGSVSSIATLLTSNGTASAAAHMALSSNTACTGFAANGGTQGEGTVDNPACVAGGVPEPSSAVLLFVGVALIGGTLLLRRREADDLAI
jgi:hypothetical protein